MRVLRINQKITSRDVSSLNKYLKEVSDIPKLTNEKEVELAEKAVNGDQKAANELIIGNLRFVISVAKQYATDKILLGDLINEGNIGLIRAIEKFDPTKGYKFISFSVWWIRKTIIEYMTNHGKIVRIPLNKVNDLSKLNKLVNKAEQESSYKVDLNQLIEENEKDFKSTDVSVLKLLGSFSVDSLDREVDTDEGNKTTALDLLADYGDENTDDLITQNDIKIEVNSVLNMLKPRDKKVMEMLFGIGEYRVMTLQEVGDELGLSKEMIRQIKNKSLNIMKNNSRAKLVYET
jgi:RNA polymerase primary sigma factor